MNSVRIGILGLLVLLLLGGTLVVAGQNSAKTGNTICIPVGTVIIKAPEGVKMKRTEVAFPHSAHFNYKCQECHHKWDGTAQIPSCAASNCHDLVQSPAKTDNQTTESNLDIRYYKTAFHQSCIGCHKEIKLKNIAMSTSNGIIKKDLQKTGPTGCVKCHPKQ